MAIESYVVVHNIAKRHNVGTLARSATAFGVSEIILVGRRDFNAFGSHGSTSHLRFRHFHSLTDACRYLKEKDCDICGVEITEGAVSVTDHPFKRSTAFLLGNEGTGLSAKECEICDFFIYIPQYGGGTASLNVTVAASIVLHHFGDARVYVLLRSLSCRSSYTWDCAVWAGFSERIREGNKFVVAERPLNQGSRKYCKETDDSIIEERKSRRENASNGFFEDGQNGVPSTNLLDSLFPDE
ncbi:tRNA/rRNA methyltransferase, SpoU [Corchorus capsularis]|uniref:tRNA/rRNA methyltransferase, SpoU n=1 Tax=Corchorus capsularis TaxID=210143 RepID=A0A1R3KXF2_COCAP|nr:tRNA/rRNA methyltransferase, SpoU [Corchorus capsularis]